MDDGYAASGWTPKPTEKPLQKDLFKRQNHSLQAGFPSSICGYITSDTSELTLEESIRYNRHADHV